MAKSGKPKFDAATSLHARYRQPSVSYQLQGTPWTSCNTDSGQYLLLVAVVFSPKVAIENSPPVSGSVNSKLQIFGIGAVAGNRPDALIDERQGQSGEGIEGDRFDPRFTTTGAEHFGHRAQGWL
ncbi:hypothetical protein [Roseovarius sp. CAU 1744]|uniref:hypothetical protein n=1 Tax=Roseovarius sp. CAU 1744 TaxID=3140368 RepID=UPI00325AEFFA